MDRFVVGFAYDNSGRVLLATKNRPDWQRGCLNGIGGKIEERESPLEAMRREGFEEAGVELDWHHKGVMKGTNNDGAEFECHIFYAYGDEVCRFQQREDEPLAMYSLDEINGKKIISNLTYLLPLGLCGDRVLFVTLNY